MTGPALPIALILVLLVLAGLFALSHGIQARKDEAARDRREPNSAARTAGFRVGGRRAPTAVDPYDGPTLPRRAEGVRTGGTGGTGDDERPTRPIPPPSGAPPNGAPPNGAPPSQAAGPRFPEGTDLIGELMGQTGPGSAWVPADLGETTRLPDPDPDDVWGDADHETEHGLLSEDRDHPSDPSDPYEPSGVEGGTSGDETVRAGAPAMTAAGEQPTTGDETISVRSSSPPPPPPPPPPRQPAPAPAPAPAPGPAAPAGETTAPDWRAEEASDPGRPTLRLSAVGRTRAGRRGPNEDAFVVTDGLLAVADGVGGHAAGQVAATLAVSSVAADRPQHAPDPVDAVRRAVTRANEAVRKRPVERPELDLRGMACTLDVAVLGRRAATGATLIIGHVGDSTVWLQSGRGRPRRLTEPHSYGGGPLLNAIGAGDEVRVDLSQEIVAAGDRVILATDGLTKVMSVEQLDGLMSELGQASADVAADGLLKAAVAAGTRDDTTVVVADVVPDPDATP